MPLNLAGGYRPQVYFDFGGHITFEIPRFQFVFWYGPFTLFHISARITERFVQAEAIVLGFIRVRLHFDWTTPGGPRLNIGRRSAGPLDNEFRSEVEIMDEQGRILGTATIGCNISVVGSSSGGFFAPFAFGSVPTVSVNGEGTVHTVIVPEDTDGIVAVDVSVPAAYLTVFDPDGVIYPLFLMEAEQAFHVDEIGTGGLNAIASFNEYGNESGSGVMFKLDRPGRWILTADESFDSTLLLAERPAAISGFGNNPGTVSVELSNLNPFTQYYLSLGISRQDEAGNLIESIELRQVEIPIGSTSFSDDDINLSSEIDRFSGFLESGEYFPYAIFFERDPSLSTPPEHPLYGMIDEDRAQMVFLGQVRSHVPVRIINPNAPAEVDGIAVGRGPNGSLALSFNTSARADMYQIEIFTREYVGDGIWAEAPKLLPVMVEDVREYFDADGTLHVVPTGEMIAVLAPAVLEVNNDMAEDGRISLYISSLTPDMRYFAVITPIATSEHEHTLTPDGLSPTVIRTTLRGPQNRSGCELLEAPEIPVITVLGAERDEEMGAYQIFMGGGGAMMQVVTDMEAEITISQITRNGNGFEETILETLPLAAWVPEGVSFAIPQTNGTIGYTPVRHFIIRAENEHRDFAEESVMVFEHVQTLPLTVDHIPAEIAGGDGSLVLERVIFTEPDGSFTIMGRTLAGLTVTAQPSGSMTHTPLEAVANDEGYFVINGSFSGQMAEYLVQVQDRFGNSQLMSVFLVRGDAPPAPQNVNNLRP